MTSCQSWTLVFYLGFNLVAWSIVAWDLNRRMNRMQEVSDKRREDWELDE